MEKIIDFLREHRFAVLAAAGILLVLITFLVLRRTIIPPGLSGQTIPPAETPGADPLVGQLSEGDGLTFRLSEGSEQPASATPLPLAEGIPLSEAEIAQILARLPALLVDRDDSLDFRLPDELIPPPRSGVTIDETFPPQAAADPIRVDPGPLEVLRFAPEGEVPIAPFVNITFNQPMVALTTLEELSGAAVPVILEPAIPGTWRWLGTKTLNFQFDSELIDRMPMATVFTVTIPSGTRSAVGGILAETISFSFSTPPVGLTTSYPHDEPQGLEPVFFVAFDQRVDPRAVLASIEVSAADQGVELRLATEEEIQADKAVSRLVEATLEGRWLAFRALQPLPKASYVTVEILAGTPSAEGPRLTTSKQSFGFETYTPLQITDHGCSGWDDNCRPLQSLWIEFNNPIDRAAYQEGMLRIAPELPGALVNIYGSRIEISGATAGQTTYFVTVDGSLTDVFGQRLGSNQTLRFRIGSAEPFLLGPEKAFVTLDPAAPSPQLSLFVMNHTSLNVRVYSVQPSDWPDYLKYIQEGRWNDAAKEPPGRLVRDATQRLEVPIDVLTEVGIELGDLMEAESGQFIVIAEPVQSLFDKDRYWETVQVWVQVTEIALDAFAEHNGMVVWATSLADGSPLAGVAIDAMGKVTLTGEDGIASFIYPKVGFSYITGSKGNDLAMLPGTIHMWDHGIWVGRPQTDELRWFVFDDRQMYRPGEEVHLKGWIRRIGAGESGDVGLPGKGLSALAYQLIGAQGNELASGTVELNAFGAFDLALQLPENVNLGYAQLRFEARGSLSGLHGTEYYHGFQIQEFRTPEFEVAARNETTGPYFLGDHAVLAVQAEYFAGGALPNAEVNWLVSSSESSYAPPNWPDFNFGSWIPWWYYYEGDFSSGHSSQEYSGVTDVTGTHYLRLDFEGLSKHQPYSVIAEGTVFDVNRQAWSSSTSLLVHPADLYVGLRSERYFVERGTPLKIDLIVTDLDGNPVEDRPIEVEAVRLEWSYNGDWQEQAVDPQRCVVGSKLEPVQCEFETPVGGRYRITATITDAQGRKNQSQFTRWVSGGQLAPSRSVEQETVTLIPNQESYQPGEVAEILVEAPFLPAEGLLTVARSGILYTERFLIEEGSITLQVPIEEAHIPNLQIQVDLVGSAPRLDDRGEPLVNVAPRPAYARGQINLNIPALQRTLELQVEPRAKELEPGGKTMIDLRLLDASGEPVSGAELALVVVDEAILGLTNYQLADPLALFYQHRPADFSSHYARAALLLTDPAALAATVNTEMAMQSRALGDVIQEAMPAEAPMAADGFGGGFDEAKQAGSDAPPIALRSDFNPLAAFAPEVRTNAAGMASVEIRLPDNLTRYRVMVVAVDAGGARFGTGGANLTARLPLMVRPSAPRFLNFGDRFEFPVVLQNQTDEALTVEVVINTGNLLLTDAAGLRVEVPPRDRIEVRFPAATDLAGTSRFQVAAVSGSYADAASGALPVYTPATTEAFATYGVVDQGAVAQPIAAPSGVFEQYGGLEISTSSTALQALTDAVLYLVTYPYECSEQLASRILGVAALRDVLSAFEAEGLPSPAEMEKAVARDLERLSSLQNWDGGFPYWRRGAESIPYNTVHVAHALQRARLKGFQVPSAMQEQVLNYLRDIESRYPHWYSEYTRREISSYALYVRALMGDRDLRKARSLFAEAGVERLSLDAIGWLWNVLVDDPSSTAELETIRRYVGNRVVETAGAANFTTAYHDQNYLLLSSDRRTDAILLDALIADDPQSDLIVKLVNGLLAHRKRGHWGNTQENVFVLLSLDRYFNTFETQTPDFVARIWLGDTYAGSHTYQGYSSERHQTDIPMRYLTAEELGGGITQDLVLSKEGEGRLYYRLGLRYAPTDLKLEALDMGFVVQRVYEAVDDPADVSRDPDGVWRIKAGARVRVRLTMVADNRRYHVALVDPLPAGFEIINPALAVSQSIPQDEASPDYRHGWWWWWTWYEHQNMRDERAEAFTTLLWDGVYEYTYLARATTPGRFVAPPAKAEEMYAPEVFGRSASDWVVVE